MPGWHILGGLAVCFVRATVYQMAVFFFFQAEDGIRDLTVTGVQTCALPISPGRGGSKSGRRLQGWYFQAPFSIFTITRARWSRPRWSFSVMLNTPCAPDTSLVCSSASRREIGRASCRERV